MMEPDRQAMLAAITAPLRIEAVAPHQPVVDLHDVVVGPAADQTTPVDRPDLKPDSSLQAAGVNHEATLAA